jgi:hypothetical protein
MQEKFEILINDTWEGKQPIAVREMFEYFDITKIDDKATRNGNLALKYLDYLKNEQNSLFRWCHYR